MKFTKQDKIYEIGEAIYPTEQKTNDKVEPKFKIGDRIVEKELDECGSGTIVNIKDGKYIFDDGCFIRITEQERWQLVEQKPIGKVEPKFKVGDCIYDKRDSYNRNVIREVGKDYYINAFAQKMDMAYTNANFEFLKHLEDDHIDSKPAAWSEEDDRIREQVVYAINQLHVCECTKNKLIGWLEKQGKKIDVIENFDTEFEKQVSHLIASAINKEHEYNQGYIKWAANALLNYAKHELEKQDEHKCDCKYVGCHVNNVKRWCHKKQSEILYEKCNIKCSEYLKQVEQKPAWSEEDENILNEFVASLKYNHEQGYNRQINWLKSLKERYTWKPTDEQMEAFEHFVRSVGESGYASPYDNNTKLLYSLLEQLKKLKE